MSISREELLSRARAAVRDRQGAVLLPADGPDRPDVLLVDRVVGLHAIEFEPQGHSPDDRAPFVRLNRKRAELRETLGDVAATRIGAAVVLGAARGAIPAATGSLVFTPADLDDPGWPDRLPALPLDETTYDAVVQRLVPALVFSRHARTTTADVGAADREVVRIQLDAAQAAAALAPIADIALVTGPPGSGKTLLLAARARHLAAAHPDWRIGVVVFNKSLTHYLDELIDVPSVLVGTAGTMAHSLGLRIDFDGGEGAARELSRARARGIPREFDALLIDEAQDFDPSWLQLFLDVVRPGRGGVMIAGDPAQGLYRDVDLDLALSSRSVVRHVLLRPYRSTRPILRVAAALAPTSRPVRLDWAMDGEPVDLVWASSWDEQAACVAAEIKAMLDNGLRQAGDIAVLVTRRAGTLKRLKAALEHRRVPHEVVDHTNVATFTPSTPTVKLITVHSGKGHEFAVVVLFGLEALTVGVDDESRRKERIAFVGATRAKDQLLITYTRENAHLKRLIALGGDVARSTWPDDYEVS